MGHIQHVEKKYAGQIAESIMNDGVHKIEAVGEECTAGDPHTLFRGGGLVEGILRYIHGDVGKLLQHSSLEIMCLVAPGPLLRNNSSCSSSPAG